MTNADKNIIDLSNGLEKYPVIFEGDSKNMPNFVYTTECVLGPGGNEDDMNLTYVACQCDGQDCCDNECPCNLNIAHYSSQGKLLPLEDPTPPILECGDLCTCGPTCCNNLVKKGLPGPLIVFHTPTRGLGVKASVPISKGSFVCEYAGELIGASEGKKRLLSQKVGDSNYIVIVREHVPATEDCLLTIVDPTHTGNVGRLINHSCNPNLTMVPVRTGSMMTRLALFARRDIEAQEELTFHYGGTTLQPPPVSQSNLSPCLCGEQNCAKFLPFNHCVPDISVDSKTV